MKKNFIILTAILLPFLCKAQITLEHTYADNSVNVATVSNSDYVYFYTDTLNLYIYSSAHTLLKTVVHGLSVEPQISNVSKTLFDTDPGYEFIMHDYTSSPYNFKVMNDDGSVLFSGVGSAFAFNTPGGAKMIVHFSNTQSKVYDLPGTLYGMKMKEATVGVGLPYPNPSASWVKLPYELNDATGSLHIIDVSGRIQKSYSISKIFSDIMVQPGTLPPGQYFYYIEADGQRSKAKPFIMN